MEYENFVFMGGWREALEGFEKDFGEEYAREVLWNLMLAGTNDDPKTDKKSILGFINGCLTPVIDKAKERHSQNQKNGGKGGRPKKDVDIEKAIQLHDMERKTWGEVAKILDVSVDTLKTARDHYAEALIAAEKRKTEKPIDYSEFRF